MGKRVHRVKPKGKVGPRKEMEKIREAWKGGRSEGEKRKRPSFEAKIQNKKREKRGLRQSLMVGEVNGGGLKRGVKRKKKKKWFMKTTKGNKSLPENFRQGEKKAPHSGKTCGQLSQGPDH